MKIRIIDIGAPETKGSGTRKYSQIAVTYRNQDYQDKVESKTLLSFTFPEVYSTLSKAQKDDEFDIKRNKNEKGFWDWVGFSNGETESTGAPAERKAVSGTSYPTKNTYETPEERALKQRLIVRQSSLANAIEFAKYVGPNGTEDDIVNYANAFYNWVYENPVHDEPEVK